ncbi:apoptosis facilitator Bcl-2-like protein 14 [Labrus mixtus]|uniref:apoptosis facilitator Bcl-2-like protein 14 n=1 Tax=Labrus mixtus TaxID=508554 RepID=UPI0029C0D26F|nr:apoptosis facilitator Bcl-2-like protein 14 [Labrus mixtus]
MANGHVEIYDPISNQKNLKSSTDCDPKSTSDTDSMEDTTEFRLLMAYAKRRHSKKEGEPKLVDQCGLPGNGEITTKTVEDEPEKKKKKKGWKRLQRILSCISPRTKLTEHSSAAGKPDVYFRSGVPRDDPKEEARLEEAVSRLSKIADDIPFIPPDVETDSPDDVEKIIGLLLREAGDRLNEEDKELQQTISRILWNYDFLERLISTFLNRMGLLPSSWDTPGPQTSPKKQIAAICEVTSRLTAADTLPMNRLFGHGARYLQKHYSNWEKELGKYEEAFYSEGEDEDDEDDEQ